MTLDRVFVLNNIISLAICRAVEQHCGVRPMVKWPNDVFLEGRKLVGVLTEFTSRGEMLDHVVVGAGRECPIGAPPTWPAWKNRPPRSGPPPAGSGTARPLLAAILRQADGLYADLEAGRMENLRDEYQQRSLLMGQAGGGGRQRPQSGRARWSALSPTAR